MKPPAYVKLSRVVLLGGGLVLVGMHTAQSAPIASASSRVASGADMAIVAVVGDEAISSYDVENRLRFVISTARLSNTPDVLKVIRPQVIRALIDEKLQIREAKKFDITIPEDEIKEAIAAIEQQRGMPSGTIDDMLTSSGVPKETFEQQIHAQLVWSKLVARRVRPNVRVSDEEVTLAARRFSMNPPKKKEQLPQEYKIGVIALPIEKSGQEKNMASFAAKLVQQIRNGASFEEVARQFSSVTASAGGKVETFWVRPGQLDPAVAAALAGAQKGTVTNPVRTSQGYTVIKVYEARDIPGKKPKAEAKEKAEDIPDTDILMKEILLKLKPEADEREQDVMLQIGGEVAKNPGTCEDKGIASLEALEDFDIEVTQRHYMLSEMPDGLKDLASKMAIQDISPPIVTYEGIRLYMLCDKKPAAGKPVNRELVYNALMQQKMDLEAQKYLRDLRSETFVEIRQ